MSTSSLAIRCSGNVLPFCVAQAMDFSIPAFRHVLPSRCLVVDVSVRKTVAQETSIRHNIMKSLLDSLNKYKKFWEELIAYFPLI
jgi:hypothetical protein